MGTGVLPVVDHSNDCHVLDVYGVCTCGARARAARERLKHIPQGQVIQANILPERLGIAGGLEDEEDGEG